MEGSTNRSEGAREFRAKVTREGKQIVKKEEEERKRGENSNSWNDRRKEDMSAVESALDVLSRAATMVQGQFTPLEFHFTGPDCTRNDNTKRSKDAWIEREKLNIKKRQLCPL